MLSYYFQNGKTDQNLLILNLNFHCLGIVNFKVLNLGGQLFICGSSLLLGVSVRILYGLISKRMNLASIVCQTFLHLSKSYHYD
jgi:hypothetical protein